MSVASARSRADRSDDTQANPVVSAEAGEPVTGDPPAAGADEAGVAATKAPARRGRVPRVVTESYRSWWTSVEQVHEVLVRPAPATEEVTEALDSERRQRRGYVSALLGAGRAVPDYLSDDLPFPPLWPTPEAPH